MTMVWSKAPEGQAKAPNIQVIITDNPEPLRPTEMQQTWTRL